MVYLFIHKKNCHYPSSSVIFSQQTSFNADTSTNMYLQLSPDIDEINGKHKYDSSRQSSFLRKNELRIRRGRTSKLLWSVKNSKVTEVSVTLCCIDNALLGVKHNEHYPIIIGRKLNRPVDGKNIKYV